MRGKNRKNLTIFYRYLNIEFVNIFLILIKGTKSEIKTGLHCL